MPLLNADFRNQLVVPYTGAQIMPVIADGNCAFRAKIQAAVLEASFATDIKRKVLYINFLKRIYEKNRDLAIALRISRDANYCDLNQIDADFKVFFTAVKKVALDNVVGFWDQLCQPYFPTEFNEDGRTYKYPAKDELIKFLAYCLRIELATQLPEGSLGLSNDAALVEYNSVDISSGAVVNYLQNTYRIFPAVFFEGQDEYDAERQAESSAIVHLRHVRDHYDVVFTPATREQEQQLILRANEAESRRVRQTEEREPQQNTAVLHQFSALQLTESLALLAAAAAVGYVAGKLYFRSQ